MKFLNFFFYIGKRKHGIIISDISRTFESIIGFMIALVTAVFLIVNIPEQYKYHQNLNIYNEYITELETTKDSVYKHIYSVMDTVYDFYYDSLDRNIPEAIPLKITKVSDSYSYDVYSLKPYEDPECSNECMSSFFNSSDKKIACLSNCILIEKVKTTKYVPEQYDTTWSDGFKTNDKLEFMKQFAIAKADSVFKIKTTDYVTWLKNRHVFIPVNNHELNYTKNTKNFIEHKNIFLCRTNTLFGIILLIYLFGLCIRQYFKHTEKVLEQKSHSDE